MKYLVNYHTHSTFCDGADSAEDMVKQALKLGMAEIGFSGHSYLPFDDGWTMTPEKAEAYRNCVAELREKYREDISVRLGIEQDYCSPTDELGLYEYVIGGVHCVFRDGIYISVDLGLEEQLDGIKKAYDGDVYAFIEDYYESVSHLYEKTKCNIVAHFDLVTKFIEQKDYIDTDNPRYEAAEDRALEALLKTPAVLEVNTGAMSRGYRTNPYPSTRILGKLADAKAPVILSSDSHEAGTLTYGFEEAEELINYYGLRRITAIDELLTSE